MTISFSPSDVSIIQSEIARIEGEISGVDSQIEFANDQLYGTASEYLYTTDQIRNRPELRSEQKIIFPAQTGVVQADNSYKNLLYSTNESVDSYEIEKKMLDGKYPVWNSTSGQIVILKNDSLGATGNVDISNTLDEPKWLIYGMKDGSSTTYARGAIKTVRGEIIESNTTITISDGVNPEKVFEFYRTGETTTPGNVGVLISDSSTEASVATALSGAINGASSFNITANTTAFDLFDESMVQTSGAGRVAPLFDPITDAINPENPGQMFGGTGTYSTTELSRLSTEITKIDYLATGYCQTPILGEIPSSCQTARIDLETCLKDRYDPAFGTGILVTERSGILSNPDLLDFPINPLTEVDAEISRITTFLNNLSSIPVTDPVPPAILTANKTAATNRQGYINTTRIPEIDVYLNTTPGYYTVRYEMLKFRVSGSGTLQEINFWLGQIVYLSRQKRELTVQRAMLESLLPT